MKILIIGGYKKNQYTGVGKYVHDLAYMLNASDNPTEIMYEEFSGNYIRKFVERFLLLPLRIRRFSKNNYITILPDESYSFLLPSIASHHKSIVIHDVRPLALAGAGYSLFREYFLRIQNFIFLRIADLVITPSNFTRESLGRGIVVPNVFDTSYQRNDSDLPLQLRGKSYLLYVGTNQFRKNFITADEVAQKAKQKYDLDFVCVGNVESKSGLNLKGLTNSQLAAIYQNAFALLNPSLFEGFGRVVIEAQIQGCPVISSNWSALDEVLGGSALLIKDPQDPLEYLIQIEKLFDRKNRTEIIEKGFLNSKRYKKDKSIIIPFLQTLNHR